MADIPENCPVRDILASIKTVLELLGKILDHCENCIKTREKE